MKNTQPLTETEKDNLYNWERDADPVSRLQSPYYTLSRTQLYADYYAELQAAGDDMLLQEEARTGLGRKLDKLNADYEADLTLAVKLHLAMCNAFGYRVELKRGN